MLPVATHLATVCSLATFKQWLGVRSTQTKLITALTSVGLVATALCAGHGYQTNQFVVIAGVVEAAYNLPTLITVLDADHFTYPLLVTASSPATGTPTVTPDDGRYATLADAASAEFETETNVPLVQRTIVERFSGTGKRQVALAQPPIAAIASVVIDGVTADPTGYVVDPVTGVLSFTNGLTFASGIKNCVVTYTGGYDVQDGPALPADAVRAVLDLGKAMHDELVSNAIAATTVSLGPSSMVIKAAKRPPSVQRVFDAYKGQGYRIA